MAHRVPDQIEEVTLTVLELIRKRRTIRRYQQKRIPFPDLKEIVDTGRLAPSASNLQPLEYIVIDDPDLVEQAFEMTKWAGYLPPASGRPPAGQTPVAFIIILINRDIRPNAGGQDVGAAAENMILTALEKGVGACWIASIDHAAMRNLLHIPDNYEIDSLLALGFPDEDPIAEPMQDTIKYYKDSTGRLHVPKRTLESVLHHNKF